MRTVLYLNDVYYEIDRHDLGRELSSKAGATAYLIPESSYEIEEQRLKAKRARQEQNKRSYASWVNRPMERG